MRIKESMRWVLAAGLTATAAYGQAAGGWFAAATGDADPVRRLHQVYLERDWQAVAGALKEVLTSPAAEDPDIAANALGLLRQAYVATNGDLPADWQAPAGVSDMKLSHNRKSEPGETRYNVQFTANIVERDTLQQLQLVRWPEEIILDKAAGLGELDIGEEADGGYKINLAIDRGEPFPDGLYLLNFTLKDGSRSGGWFVFSDLTATATPVVQSPAVGERFRTANPELVWTDFKSPEYKAHESRTLALGITRLMDDNPGWETSWSLYLRDPGINRAVIGQAPGGDGVTALQPGRYWGSVSYFEQRKFGPLKLRRGARTGRQFHVDP